jgi:hypothetical protein
MGADSLGVNTTNAPEFICPSPKVLDFNAKRLHWASVVRVMNHKNLFVFAHSFFMHNNFAESEIRPFYWGCISTRDHVRICQQLPHLMVG